MARRTILELEEEPGASALNTEPKQPASTKNDFEIELKIPATKSNALLPEQKEKWKTLQGYAKEKRQIVLLIGQTGAAKTVITASLNYAAMVRHASVTSDPTDNQHGARYLNGVIKTLLDGRFPAGNPEGFLEYYDTEIFFSGQKTPITFVEMAGGDFEKFDPEYLHRGSFFKELVKFLQLNPRIIILLVAPSNKAREMNLYFRDCISHLLKIDKNLTKHLGIIISKWDLTYKNGTRKASVNDFVRKNMPAAHALMGQKEINTERRYYRFSVGKVTPSDNGLAEKIEGDIKMNDCYPILDWIKEVLIDAPLRSQVDDLEVMLKEKRKELEKVNQGLDNIKYDLKQAQLQGQDITTEKNAKQTEAAKAWFDFRK